MEELQDGRHISNYFMDDSSWKPHPDYAPMLLTLGTPLVLSWGQEMCIVVSGCCLHMTVWGM